MALTVRVDDYYNNDENGLWSWYLRNIRSGDFEELTTNKLKYTLLKRFLNDNIYNNKNIKNFNKNQKFLFISIPDKIHSDISILETFLKDYFHLEDLNNIKIQKLTRDQCYNHENHYFLTDTTNNFNDPTFLNYVDPKRYNRFKSDLDQIASTKTDNNNIHNHTDKNIETNNNLNLQNTQITQESSMIITKDKFNNIIISQEKSINNKSNNNNNHSEQNVSQNNNIHPKITNKELISKISDDDDDDDDDESSIVLDFPRASSHHIRRSNQNSERNKQIPPTHDSISHLSVNSINNSSYNTVGNDHAFTPPGSEIVSINSYYNDNDINSYAEKASYNEEDEEYEECEDDTVYDNDGELSRHPLRRMITVEDEEEENSISNDEDEDEDEDQDVEVRSCHSFISSRSGSSYTSSYSDISLSSSASSYYSILPSISINDKGDNFKLVLQSCLLYKENKEILTAIRQSNNAVDVASVDDDWILYDSQFNMNNLTILTLKELFEFGHDIPKILFYSMVIVNSSIQKISTTNDIENGNNNSTDYSERIDKLSGSNNDELDINDESNNDLRQENPKLLYDDTEEPQMCAPERMVSNTTTVGHRSIRTINTMGEWAYRKKSNITFGNGGSEVGDSSPKNFQDDPNEDKDIEKRNNIARWKSVPNHNNNSNNNDDDDNNSSSNSSGSNNPDSKLSSSHQTAVKNRFNRSNYKKGKYDDGVIHSGGKRWNLKIKKFKRPSDTKKYNDDKICMIM